MLKDAALTTFSFKILLPKTAYSFVQTQSDFKPPSFYLEQFEKFNTEKKPVRLIITRTLPDGQDIPETNILVSVESYTVEENAGEEGEFWVELNLEEYRQITVERIDVLQVNTVTGKTEAVKEAVRAGNNSKKAHTVVSGDTLWKIAKLYLNNGGRYQEIADLNNIKDANKIYVGQVLLMPEL